MLRSRGHLFLNEVYDMLGYPRIKEGNIIGWIYDEKNPVGDNFVDFNIYPLNGIVDQAKINFINGDERSILLDFNVDGPILDLIWMSEGLNSVTSGNVMRDIFDYPWLFSQ